ncbi:MAG TPA: hypothetical protein VIH90_05450 [Candidatus Saccharimonadales bacterium]
MKKICVLLYGISLLSISLYGLSNHSYYVRILINLGGSYMVVRIALVMALVFYAFIPWLRIYFTRSLLGICGVTLLALGIFTTLSPSLLGHLNAWVLPGDDLALIEAGILAIVLSADLSARRTRLMAAGYDYLQSLLVTPSRRLIHSLDGQKFQLHHTGAGRK